MRGRRQLNLAGGELARLILMATLVAGLLTSGVATMARALTIEIGPRVGDILVFRRGSSLPEELAFTVAMAAAPTRLCTLHPATMASDGGSLVVEQRFAAPRTYRVHWAGARTSAGGTDCGRGADLVLNRLDLQLLSNLVGGSGVTPRTMIQF